jgi:hypothetical protein
MPVEVSQELGDELRARPGGPMHRRPGPHNLRRRVTAGQRQLNAHQTFLSRMIAQRVACGRV